MPNKEPFNPFASLVSPADQQPESTPQTTVTDSEHLLPSHERRLNNNAHALDGMLDKRFNTLPKHYKGRVLHSLADALRNLA